MLAPFFDYSLALVFFSSLFSRSFVCLVVCRSVERKISAQPRRNVCVNIYIWLEETNETEKEDEDRKRYRVRWKEKESKRRANSNICYTANNDVSERPTYRKLFTRTWYSYVLNAVLVLFTYCIPHPCSHIYVSAWNQMKTILGEHITF